MGTKCPADLWLKHRVGRLPRWELCASGEPPGGPRRTAHEGSRHSRGSAVHRWQPTGIPVCPSVYAAHTWQGDAGAASGPASARLPHPPASPCGHREHAQSHAPRRPAYIRRPKEEGAPCRASACCAPPMSLRAGRVLRPANSHGRRLFEATPSNISCGARDLEGEQSTEPGGSWVGRRTCHAVAAGCRPCPCPLQNLRGRRRRGAAHAQRSAVRRRGGGPRLGGTRCRAPRSPVSSKADKGRAIMSSD